MAVRTTMREAKRGASISGRRSIAEGTAIDVAVVSASRTINPLLVEKGCFGAASQDGSPKPQ